MRVWQRPVILVNTALALAVLGGGFWAYRTVAGPETAPAATTGTRLVAATQGDVTATATATGSVASAATATANFATSGTVTSISVKVGDAVKKGQVLAKIDPAAAQAALDTAEDNLAAAEAAPDELTAIFNVMPMPPLPFVPAEAHGRTVIMAMLAYAGDAAGADAALAPFRAVATPLADLVGPAPVASLYIPEDPDMRPAVTMRALYMERLGIEEARTLLAQVGRCESPMWIGQIRVLGGAAARVGAGDTAYAHRTSRMLVGFLALHGGPTTPHERWAADGIAALRQGDGGAYVNFVSNEGPERLRAAYPGATWERLRRVKATYDPENLFRLNNNFPPAA